MDSAYPYSSQEVCPPHTPPHGLSCATQADLQIPSGLRPVWEQLSLRPPYVLEDRLLSYMERQALY